MDARARSNMIQGLSRPSTRRRRLAPTATPVQLDGVAREVEPRSLGQGANGIVDGGVLELLHGPTAAADQVVVMVGCGGDVTNAPVLEHHAADEAQFKEELHRAEDGSPTNVGYGLPNFLDGEGSWRSGEGFEHRSPGRRQPASMGRKA